jgi:leader peptidase (prepilin peptidase)/N-methyltransferase
MSLTHMTAFTVTFSLFSFLLGAVVGSFLNVVVLRYGTRALSGRSHCFTCGKILHWYELLPVISFLAQRGRCRGCKAGISAQYPIVELLTGIVFVLIFLKESSLFLSFSILHTSYFILHLALWSELIALSIYDFRHKIIPDALVYSSALIALALWSISYFILHTSYLRDLWSGFFMAAPFALIWFFSRGRAMGLGDAKLAVFFPWLLGVAKGLSAIIIGFWLGAIVSVAALMLKAVVARFPRRFFPTLRARFRTLSLKTELPLGPFLALGLFLVYVFGWDITGLEHLLR